MANVYTQLDKATASISVYAIADDGEIIGRVILKHGTQLTAFCHIYGLAMTKGIACGGGYDRASAAVQTAFGKTLLEGLGRPCNAAVKRVQAALSDEAQHWDNALRAAGFAVQQIV